MTFSHKNKRPVYRSLSPYRHNPGPSFQLHENLALCSVCNIEYIEDTKS